LPITFDPRDFSVTDTIRCGSEMRRIIDRSPSIEDAAQSVTEFLYNSLIADDQPACALVRCYKTHPFNELPPDLQGFARNALKRKPDNPRLACLTLLGTTGSKPEWNTRLRSIGHQAIPLANEQMIEQAPMVSQLIRQLGLDAKAVITPTPQILQQDDGKSYGVFYVPRAAGSPYIPAQQDFVLRDGIQSVVGFGGLLRTGDMIAVILFSRVPIPEETAKRFRTLALDLRAGMFAAGERPAFKTRGE
jgi:hypothetical protein